MKKLFKKLSIFFIIYLAYKLLLLLFISSPYAKSLETKIYYGASNPDKLNKIVLVGASNVEYNYDLQLLNEKFPNFNVLTAGLPSPSGLAAITRKVSLLQLDENDIVIMSITHGLYLKDNFLPSNSPHRVAQAKMVLADAFRSFPLEASSFLLSVDLYDIYLNLKLKVRNEDELIFIEEPVHHDKKKYIDCWTNDENTFRVSSDGFDKDYLIKMKKWLENRLKCKVLFRFPVLKANEHDIDEERVKFLEANFNYLNTFESSIYEDELWYDKWYHLNACGRDLSTKKLLKELEKNLVKP